MSTANDVTKAVKEAHPIRGLQTVIQEASKELGKALPAHLSPERLVRIALTLIRVNPDLSKCTQESFLGALFTSAQVGVELVGGKAYILPFNNSRRINGEWKTIKEAQFILGYPGVVDLYYRHSKSVDLSWGVVKDGDEFDYEFGTSAFLKHKHGKKRGEAEYFWVMASLKDGGKVFHVMSFDECMNHGREHSKTYNKKDNDFYPSSPWRKSEGSRNSMCLKTVLLQAGKLIPKSSELQKALSVDESSRDFRDAIKDAINVTPSNTDWEENSSESPESPAEPDKGQVDPEPPKAPEKAKSVAKQGKNKVVSPSDRKPPGGPDPVPFQEEFEKE